MRVPPAASQGAEVLGGVAAAVERAKKRQLVGGGGGLLFAQVGQLVLDVGGATVRAMSPTADAMTESDRELGESLQVGWDAVDTALRDDNRCSVVLHLDLRGTRAILCADLLRHALFGWAAVLADPLNQSCVPVDLVKAGHHGGESGHDDEMWVRLVGPEPVVFVAPYSSSRLPSPPDIARLTGLSGQLWEAAPADGEWIGEDGTAISVRGETGFVRARRRTGENNWRVDAGMPGRQRHP